jgi:hypothetical protein
MNNKISTYTTRWFSKSVAAISRHGKFCKFTIPWTLKQKGERHWLWWHSKESAFPYIKLSAKENINSFCTLCSHYCILFYNKLFLFWNSFIFIEKLQRQYQKVHKPFNKFQFLYCDHFIWPFKLRNQHWYI